FMNITKTEVEEALEASSAASAPGPSQVTYKLIKWSWKYMSDHITGLVWHAVKGGQHPEVFRRAIACALRKAGKPDYSKPRAYRLITLLECLGKLIE
ncbi:hypothetical protein BKA62DRAFT_588767, partial [Auriculariales sp. MPI-PUGE-AT-0066]